MKIRAAVLPRTGAPLEVGDLELAGPQPGEVLVRLHASGVCHSDLNAVDGIAETRCPAVLGHEGAGVVEEVGDGVRIGSARADRDFLTILDQYRRGRLPLDRLVSHRLPLEGIGEAFDLLRAGHARRAVITL